MISVHFQGKPFNITVVQVHALTSNAEEAEVEWFYEDLQDLLELTPKKDVLFIIGDWNAKVRSQETPGITGKFGLGVQNEAGQRLIEFCQEKALVKGNTLFKQHKRRPIYIARRVTRFASEDVGLADPRALELAVAAYQACHLIGMPECSVHLTQAVVYLSLAPKSNALDVAYMRARTDALNQLAEPVPLHIRNGVTKLMKELGYGKGYQYAHDTVDKLTDMRCLPDSLLGRTYYEPTEQGLESRFKERLEQIKAWKKAHEK